MLSRSDARLRLIAMPVLFTTLLLPGAALVQQPADIEGESPGQAEIARALEKVKADPNLATERTIKTLRWKDSNTKKPSGTPAWLAWIAGLFRWLGESARVLVWCAAATLSGLLVVFIIRLVRKVQLPPGEERFVAPTHVRDLDIRPETLPADIGAAARALWDRGAHRASLALLYRGLLSRLAHVHRVPIRDSSTEGDCLDLATRLLPPARREYTSRLVRVWQRAVYGHEEVQTTTVYGLCDGFAASLNRVSPLDPSTPGDVA